MLSVFSVSTAAKVLLFPAYRSTDFDVHNHWKSLTRHFHNQSEEWYFDDDHVQTVHTLDYPPAFAWFEYLWSNNYVTDLLVRSDSSWLDKTCLELKPSSPSPLAHSVPCVAFMRTTVLLSEVVYWVACYIWACLIGKQNNQSQKSNLNDRDAAKANSNDTFSWTCFLLFSLNPAILWLDHVHFQYNGFLLGILLLSLACLWQGVTQKSWALFHFHHLAGAFLFALLLTLKHLYIVLSLWYFCYLLRRYCFVTVMTTSQEQGKPLSNTNRLVFSVPRLIVLGVVTVMTLVIPFLPLVMGAAQRHADQEGPVVTLFRRIGQRLFPFGRGLVHDYWAGNIWALYMVLVKLKLPIALWSPDDFPPNLVAVFLLVSLLPGCWSAWKTAARADHLMLHGPQTRRPLDPSTLPHADLLSGVSYSALASFMTAYHVHEKAIVTTLLPLTLWALVTTTSANSPKYNNNTRHGLLLFRVQAWGLTGLLPLLFPASEWGMKLVTLTGYLVYLHYAVLAREPKTQSLDQRVAKFDTHGSILRLVFTPQQEVYFVTITVICVVVPLEFVPISIFGRFEFMPLALTSLVVASGLCVSSLELLYITLWT